MRARRRPNPASAIGRSAANLLAPWPGGSVPTATQLPEPPTPTSPAGRGQRAGGGLVPVWQVSVGVAGLGLWQLLTAAGVLDPFFFSRPSAVAARLWRWLGSGFIYEHLYVTLQEAFIALVLGAVAGLLLGLLLARLPVLAQTLNPYLAMLNALPRVVLAPIFLLWFGFGISSKVALGITLVFFPVFFNTYQGAREVDPVLLDNARLLGASQRQLLRHVVVPSALTWLFSSLHVSVGLAIVGAVVGEYLGSARGVGYVIAQAEGLFDTTGVFAGMAVLMIVVLALDQLVNRLERRLLRWRPNSSPSRPTDSDDPK